MRGGLYEVGVALTSRQWHSASWLGFATSEEKLPPFWPPKEDVKLAPIDCQGSISPSHLLYAVKPGRSEEVVAAGGEAVNQFAFLQALAAMLDVAGNDEAVPSL